MKLHVYILFACFSMQQILQAAGNPLIDQLNAAFRNNQEDVFIKLLEANPDFDVNTPLDADQNTGLHNAATKGWTNATTKLLQLSANPNSKTSHWSNPGTTPLMVASAMDKDDIAKLLLKAGANVNAETKDGKTALYIALVSKKPKMVGLLLDSGADFDDTIKSLTQSPAYNGVYAAVLEKAKLYTKEHKRALQEASQKVISGTGPLQAQQTAGKTIQEYLR